ncbi:DUF2993 domain-containing protein [Corynebacterium nuruki]|uniref:LmeA family phospholipid-binding protein n=1 Tax=Corynebacterium nuruki TaxID=1032851 RepID=UPI001EE6838A|nr:DUF2993 domain-containing protein [Corynebacterium nuruki]
MTAASTAPSTPGTPGTRPSRRSPVRILVIVVVAVLGLTGVAVVADALVAARVERQISRHLYEDSKLATPPSVMVSGMPYIAAAWSHQLPSIHVEARDIDVPDFGRVTMSSTATKLTLTRDEVLSGDFTDAPAKQVFTRAQIDSVALGDKMGFDDLHLEAVENISPVGGWETEAYFTGTPRGEQDPWTVTMRLRVWEGDVLLRPTEIRKAPGGRDPASLDEAERQRIFDAFTYTFHGPDLPLRALPGRVYISGGALFVESEQNYIRVSISDLAPRSAPLGTDAEAGL